MSFTGRTFWITRDEVDDGDELEGYVEIWTARPENLGGAWIAFEDGGNMAERTVLTVEACRAEFGVIPETSRECIRVER